MKATNSNRQLLVLTATILGSAVVFLDSTVVNIALPKIASDLNTDFSALQWIVDGYLLSLASLILLGGSLGDIFGRKKVYVFGLVGFGVTSLLCALSVDATMLVIVRVLQGIFGALVTPGALALINTNIPRENRGQAIGRWTAWTSVFFIIGPLVGGLILGITSWRWIFFINLPLIAFCLALALPSVTDSKDTNPRQIDFAGAGLAALALAGTTYGLIEGPTHHWTWPTVAAIIAGFLIAAIFVWYESRANDPMVKLSLFKSRNFTGSNLMTFAMYGAIAGFTFALTIYLQTKLHYSSLQAGLSLLPVSLTLWLFSGRVGRLSSIYGPRRFMTMGPIIAGIGIGLLYMLNPGDNYLLGVLPGALVFSAGLVLTVAPLTTTVMMSVDETSSGIASGINNAVARAAALIVVAALGLLGASQFYHFSMALCAALAILAGLISFAVIERVPATKPAPVKE